MIDRACISINNCCNLNCIYCHFHTQEKIVYLSNRDMNVFTILDSIKNHVDKYGIKSFKLGFVGNGEPLLSFGLLRKYIEYISDYITDNRIAVYTITNGTLVTKEMLVFFKNNNVSIGFSIDGLPDIHNKWRCNTFNMVMKAIELYYSVNGKYPPMNCTVGKDSLSRAEETIAFFEQFGSKITFSRMIGKDGISLSDFHGFLDKAKMKLDIRTGVYDCTMYGGKCGSGINGSKLADAHNRLGKKLGEVMNTIIPSTGTAVIVLERGGRFFGDGIYTGFGGTFYAYNPKKDKLPNIQNSAAVIVDSVINTGNSVLATIEKIKEDNPDIDIVIAVNVIQEKALKLLNEYKVFAIRTSQNSFVGNRQAVQKDGKGPDTADRLYNYIC